MTKHRRGEESIARRIIASLRPAIAIGPSLTVGQLQDRLCTPDAPTAVVVDGPQPRVIDALTALRSDVDEDAPATSLECCGGKPLEVTAEVGEILSVVMAREPEHRGHDLVFATEWGTKLLAMPVVTALLVESAADVKQVDMLTGLPGRASVHAALREAMRRDPESVAVAFVDLDRFKEINDIHGHAVGDRVLQVVGRRLRHGLRKGDVVGRIGGDEFVAVMRVEDADEARRAAHRLVAHLAEPVEQAPSTVTVGTSVGVALSAGIVTEASDPLQLIADADALMYLAKQRGGGVLLAGDVGEVVVTRTQLADALGEGELELQYQPIVPLDGTTATAVEALVRWPDPDGGTLQPSAFVPLAEATGQIVDLDWWALETAIEQLSAWDESDRMTPLTVAVNLSSTTLAMPGLVSHVERLLSIVGISPERLTVEISERTIVNDRLRSRDVLTALHAIGVRTAIDDFAIGNSNLAELSRLHVSMLKIDQAFVERLTLREVDRSVVRVVRALADELGLAVVAKGVESLEQAIELGRLGVTHAQGWLWAPALDARMLGDSRAPVPRPRRDRGGDPRPDARGRPATAAPVGPPPLPPDRDGRGVAAARPGDPGDGRRTPADDATTSGPR